MNKKLLTAVTFTAMLGLASCENLPETPEIPKEFTTYTVSLNCTGEIETSQNPLKGFTPSSEDLYAIQVYYAPASGGSYKKYAYGLFDDVSNVSLELISDHKYKFVIDMVQNGKNVIYSDSLAIDSNNYIGYDSPFNAYNGYNGSTSRSITRVTNQLEITEEHYFDNLGSYFKLKDGIQYSHAENVNSYFGITTDFIPTADGESVSIYLKRMIYGLKITAGDFLTEGTVTIKAYNTNLSINLTPENKTIETTIAYGSGNNAREYWYNYETLESATTSIYLEATWHKNDSTSITLNDLSVDFCRMKQTEVNLTFYENDTAGDKSLTIKYEDAEIVESYKSYTHGDDQSDYKW